MNHETLERLLIDRRLGELTEDTEALLKEVLRLAPDTAPIAERIDATLELASRALRAAKSPAAPLPPLNSQSLAIAAKRPISSTALPGRFAIAAALILTFWLGGRMSSPTSISVSDRTPQLQITKAIDASPVNVWSLGQLAARSVQTRTSDSANIQWTSPIARPQLGAKS
ncbi:MAG: hypothetical protein AABZ08_03955 [Planctomycetota bacterium]